MNDLINNLTADLKPVKPGAARRRIGLSLVAGGAVSFTALALSLGMRADFTQAVFEPGFWLKLGVTLALAAVAFLITCRLASPGRGPGLWLMLGAAIILVVVSVGATQLTLAAPDARPSLWLGESWRRCLVSVSLLSVPVFLSTLHALRRLAPTQLRQAGLAAGLLSGSVGASLYALACQEHSTAFLATWYLAGIAFVGVLGALAGPRILRW